jgi:hypothetical protein
MSAKSRKNFVLGRTVTEIDRGRLAALLNMFGSAYDGEVTNAARAAERLRRAADVSWSELLESGGDKRKVATEAAKTLLRENQNLRAENERLRAALDRPAVPQPWDDASNSLEGAQGCLLWRDHLTDWEEEFLESLLRRRRRLTPKQLQVLKRIGEKVDRAIRTSWRYRRAAA